MSEDDRMRPDPLSYRRQADTRTINQEHDRDGIVRFRWAAHHLAQEIAWLNQIPGEGTPPAWQETSTAEQEHYTRAATTALRLSHGLWRPRAMVQAVEAAIAYGRAQGVPECDDCHIYESVQFYAVRTRDMNASEPDRIMCRACADAYEQDAAPGLSVTKTDPLSVRDARVARQALAIYQGVLDGTINRTVPEPTELSEEETQL